MNKILSVFCMCAMALQVFAAPTYTAKAKITITSANADAKTITLRQAATFSDGYDDGYDAEGLGSDLYVIASNNSHWQQWATNNLDGAIIGFKSGVDETYTITVSNVAGSETLYLWDWDFKSYALTEGASYTFDAEANATIENRFSIHKVIPIQLKGDVVGTDCGANNDEWCDEPLAVSANNETASYTQHIETGWYNFGLYINGVYKNNNDEWLRDANEQGGFDATTGSSWMYADVAGDYTFTWTYATQKLTITYPDPTPAPTCTTVRNNLVANRYYTICLPKAVTAANGASFWSMSNRGEGVAYLEEVQLPLVAGRPYIFQAEDDELCVELSGDDAVAGAAGALVGTFTPMDQSALDAAATAASSDIYLLYNNELWLANGQSGNNLPAYRAYVVYNQLILANPTPAPGRRVRAIPMQGQTATGVENLNASEAPAKAIIDGKLYIIRGEQMFDATGRLVK